MMTSPNINENINVVRRLYDALNRSDLNGILDQLSDRVELVDVPSGKLARGKSECHEYFRKWLEAFPDGRGEVTHFISSGDEIAVEVLGRGTQTGPFITPMGRIAPSGKPTEIRFFQFYKIADSKIVGARSYYDVAGLMRSLGATPLKKAA